jgi:hypothetical protein
MDTSLEKLLTAAKDAKPSTEQQEEQRRSFAYGNTNIENPRVTRKTVDEEADKLSHT